MTHVACRLTAKNRDQLRNPTLGNRVCATFIYLFSYSWGLGFTMRVFPGSISWMVVFWGGEVVRGMNECLHSPRLGPVCPRAGLHGASDQQLDSVSSQLVIQLRGPGQAGGRSSHASLPCRRRAAAAVQPTLVASAIYRAAAAPAAAGRPSAVVPPVRCGRV